MLDDGKIGDVAGLVLGGNFGVMGAGCRLARGFELLGAGIWRERGDTFRFTQGVGVYTAKTPCRWLSEK